LAWKIEFTKKAKKEFIKLDKTTQKQISKFISKIEYSYDPKNFGEALTGDLHMFWKYRVGNYRLICNMKDDVFMVQIIRIGHRREVYKKEI